MGYPASRTLLFLGASQLATRSQRLIPERCLSMFEPYSRNMFGSVMVKTPLQWFPRDFPLNQFVDSFAGILSMGQSFIETPVDCLDPALDEFHLMPP